ncbi:P-loop containing nucleoside triphosphate hydrolase protein [Panus rudis PR-1116 ss-1]|nr:P-loop containing nucleoside triphosphate hydrolase protein [Panus rudis PR-1116 ss-1]
MDNDIRKLTVSHDKIACRSQQNLVNARTTTEGWDSQKIRENMATAFRKASGGKCAYDWQLDVAEALQLGLDCTVVAGTGSGKTIPYALPLLLPENNKKIIIVISPLKALQRDQARRFCKLGIRAAAINENTFTPAIKKEIEAFKYQALFLSPEMCLKTNLARDMITSLGASQHIIACIIDEAHCISEWGGDFRKTYQDLSQLRAMLTQFRKVPFGAFSATLTPSALKSVLDTLLIEIDSAYYINRGNDRPNIKMEVQEINGAEDFNAIDSILNLDKITTPDDIPKTLIFVNERMQTLGLWRYIRSKLRACDPSFVTLCDYLHGLRGELTKEIVMDRFFRGETKILVATEAVGMGADIPDVELVIQFCAPKSLAVWVQRTGRAGRLPTIQATAIMLVEKSAFQTQKAPAERSKKTATSAQAKQGPRRKPPDILYKKQVDPSLRNWLESPTCRRDGIDEFFHNPPQASVLESSSTVPTPTYSRLEWHETSFSSMAVLPDDVIKTLSWDATLCSVEDIRRRFDEDTWLFVSRHAQDVLDVLASTDREWEERTK